MTKKIGWITLITIFTVGAYLLMLALQSATNEIIATVNASANWSGVESSQAVILSFPLWQWGVPGLVGIVMVVMVWKKKG